MKYLAHSGRANRGIPVQEYRDHVQNVVTAAIHNAKDAARFSSKFGDLLRASVRLAAEYHDLGKLDDVNQKVLQNNSGKMLNHVDAGVAALLNGKMDSTRLAAAITIYAHHIGLPEIAAEGPPARNRDRMFRDEGLVPNGVPLLDHTNQLLTEYLRRHRESTAGLSAVNDPGIRIQSPPLLLRLALSCLVDADHSDTARHYRDPAVDKTGPLLDPSHRLALLDSYVANLGRNRNDARSQLRASVYRQCRDSVCDAGLWECDSPVGSGKTTAIMAHLLNAAALKCLRRVFVVLPFTNIIDQSVDVYRKALVSGDEAPEYVVAAHHHKAEFDDAKDPSSRPYSFLWHAPVVVTTAVQFFETLASRRPASVRKLHQLAGSAIFIDEAHAALPVHLWPQAWKWLDQLQQDWNCHIVLGSGSLNRFWQLTDFVDPTVKLPALVSEPIRDSAAEQERARVKFISHPQILTLDGLVRFIRKVDGPRLLIVNTVQSAAAIARHLADTFGGEKVEHLSTALTPSDRRATLELVKGRLRQSNHRDWTLVATSCVEAGVDISFRTGIRERSSLTSILQLSGRVNRSNEFGQGEVWDIQLQHDHLLRPHPAFEASARILGELFFEDKVSAEYCTEALRREITQEGMPKKKKDIDIAERNADFPTVEKLFRVIDSETITAIVDRNIVDRLEAYQHVSTAEIQAASVQIWHNKAQQFGLESLDRVHGYEDLRKWNSAYDNFLGYMAGVLPLIDFGREGAII
jgi:CRISPR-associated endonuclease/helicase Cas3